MLVLQWGLAPLLVGGSVLFGCGFQLFGQFLQFSLQGNYPVARAFEDLGLGVKLLSAHHIEAGQGGLCQLAHAFIYFTLDAAAADQVTDLLQDFPGWWGWF